MLDPEDRLAIEQLYARYCALIDLGDYETWSRCFTDDACFRGTEEARGRQAIADLGRRRIAPASPNPRVNRQHWNSNLIVEGTPERAHGLCYLINVGRERSSGRISSTTQGIYEDELVKMEGKWLFKSRTLHFDTPPPAVMPHKRANEPIR